MALFTLFSISCLPASIVGGLFGMNVRVPFQSDGEDTLKPFLIIVAAVVFTTIALFLGFAYALKKT
jgi:Mg2+ and Co2+ transporter CorA